MRADDGRDRTEDLALRQLHVVLHIRKDVRRQNETIRPTAEHLSGSRIASLLNEREKPLHLGLVDDRADHCGWVIGIADLQAFDPFDEAIDEAIIDLIVHDEPIDGDADLTLVEKLAENPRLDRMVEVGIAEHHEGTVAAKLEVDPLQDRRLRCELTDMAANRRRSGERNDPRRGVADEGIADLAAPGDDDVEHPFGQPSLLKDLREQQGTRDGRVAGRLDDHGIADGQGRCHGAHREMKGPVPRADDADDADRLAIDPALLAFDVGGQVGRFDKVRSRGRPLQDRVRRLPFEIGLEACAAGFGDQPIDNFLSAKLHHLRCAPHDLRALERQLGNPVLVRPEGGSKGIVEVALACLLNR